MRVRSFGLAVLFLTGVFSASADADLFLPGPWIVSFAPSSSRPIGETDRNLAEQLDNVVRVLGRDRLGYAACAFPRSEPLEATNRLARRRLLVVAKIIKQRTALTVAIEPALCADQAGRPQPGVYIVPGPLAR